MAVSAELAQQVAQLLGRTPRGLEAIAVASDTGAPMVIRVASLVDDKPFPTLFWLVDSSLNYRIDQVEATGLIAHFQAQINASPALREAMINDHRAYMVLRDQYITVPLRAKLETLGYGQVFEQKGIGGIADFSRIRCLHTWYAAHLVVPNTIGKLLDEHWENYPA